MGPLLSVAFCILAGLWSAPVFAQPEGYKGVVAGPKVSVLFQPGRMAPMMTPIPKNSKLQPLDELQIIGPEPGHPFILGNFAVDGRWCVRQGAISLLDGKNAALQLAWADEFELEGVIEQAGFGGWFLLVGWDDDRGYAIHNVVLKDSGSPWFISEFVRGTAVEDGTVELDKFEWKGEQPFRIRVQDETVSLEVGRFRVFENQPLEGYQPGRVILGVYDTRYGPRPMRIKSLKIRSIQENAKTKPKSS